MSRARSDVSGSILSRAGASKIPGVVQLAFAFPGGTDVVLDVGGYSPAMEVMPEVPGGTLGAPVTYGSTYLNPGALESLDMNGDGRIDAANAYDGIGFVAVRLQQTNGLVGGELDFPVPYTTTFEPKGIALGVTRTLTCPAIHF